MRFLFLSIFVFYNYSLAQFSSLWTKVQQINSPLINAVYFYGDNIYVGTDSIFISTDKGITWKANLITNTPVEVTAFVIVNGVLYVGTYGEGVYKSSDNGSSWDQFSSGLTSWGKYIRSFLVSGDAFFLGTDGGGVYYSNLKSSISWIEYNQNLPSKIAWSVNSMCLSGENLIISAGASGFYYIRSKGSTEWMEMRIDTTGRKAVTPNVLLALGDTVFAGARQGIFRSIDNGLNWDSVGISAIPINVNSLVLYKNRIYAGLSRSNDFYTWYSDDGGLTWNFQNHELTPMNSIYLYDDKLWASTLAGLWYRNLGPTKVEQNDNKIKFILEQNYPNPFNPVTKISYEIPSNSFVDLRIFDILGCEVKLLVNEEQVKGNYTLEFDGKELPSGIYLYVLRNENNVSAKKMMLVR